MNEKGTLWPTRTTAASARPRPTVPSKHRAAVMVGFASVFVFLVLQLTPASIPCQWVGGIDRLLWLGLGLYRREKKNARTRLVCEQESQCSS